MEISVLTNTCLIEMYVYIYIYIYLKQTTEEQQRELE